MSALYVLTTSLFVLHFMLLQTLSVVSKFHLQLSHYIISIFLVLSSFMLRFPCMCTLG